MGWGCNSGQQPEDITFSIISLSANQKLVQHLPEKEFSSTLIGLVLMGREFSHKILGIQLCLFNEVGHLLITGSAFPPKATQVTSSSFQSNSFLKATHKP